MQPTVPSRYDFSVFAQYPAVAYLFLVRRMRTVGVVIFALLALQAVVKDPERIPAADG